MLRKSKNFVVISLSFLFGLTFVLSLYAQEIQKRRGYWSEKLHLSKGATQEYPENYWSHTELPILTDGERLKLALKARANWKEYYREASQRAKELSDKLENYIQAWFHGEVETTLPEGLLPPYIDNLKTKNWTLMKPEDVTPEKQWCIIPSHEIDPEYKRLYMLGADCHVTYAKLIFVAPIGSKLLIEGDFPHARFMDYEILPPFDPEHPATGTMGENPEVPIVDVDIEPDPGHINPFRVGANRNAEKRHYHLIFELQAGNAVDLNPQAMQSPKYRASGNTRIGGPFGFAGSWGDGAFTVSILWLRIYAPDKRFVSLGGISDKGITGLLGGVSLPKALLQLPSGEKFWLQPDASLAIERQTTRVAAGYQAPQEPYPFMGSHWGWFKIFGLVLVRAENKAYFQSEPWGRKPVERTKDNIRKSFFLLFNRGPNATPPGNYESSATCCNYNSYLTRTFQRGQGKLYVITGKLPTTPKTRNGEPIMTSAQARYWSISQYGKGEDDKYETAVHYGSLMDDEIVINENNEYIIVYSSSEDRPTNATAKNGITWQNWGPRSRQTITIRWMSVMPDWHLPEFAPDENNIPWEKGAWSQANYDKSLVGENKSGIMGPYHPVIHYMAKEEFEALGHRLLASKDIPKWTAYTYRSR